MTDEERIELVYLNCRHDEIATRFKIELRVPWLRAVLNSRDALLVRVKELEAELALNTGNEPDTQDCNHPNTCGFCRARAYPSKLQ